LPEQQREMLVLRHMVGWQVKEIAVHMQIPANTVSVTIRRLLASLRQNWPDIEGGTE
jgi:RNA polymerase sigma factor (sigma-70 family)